jgi:hypothetical protein
MANLSEPRVLGVGLDRAVVVELLDPLRVGRQDVDHAIAVLGEEASVGEAAVAGELRDAHRRWPRVDVLGLAMATIQELFDRLRRAPFPRLGKRVGDFPLYDSLLAGCTERASRGELVPPSEIPVPDDETLKCVAELRQKSDTSPEERAFLEYFDLLEEIRVALHRQSLE